MYTNSVYFLNINLYVELLRVLRHCPDRPALKVPGVSQRVKFLNLNLIIVSKDI